MDSPPDPDSAPQTPWARAAALLAAGKSLDEVRATLVGQGIAASDVGTIVAALATNRSRERREASIDAATEALNPTLVPASRWRKDAKTRGLLSVVGGSIASVGLLLEVLYETDRIDVLDGVVGDTGMVATGLMIAGGLLVSVYSDRSARDNRASKSGVNPIE